MKVNEFMIRNVITAHPEQTIKEVMELLVENKIGGLPICDSAGKLQGMISDGDIIRTVKPIDKQIINFVLYMEYVEGQDLLERLAEVTQKPILSIAKTRGLVTVSPYDDIENVVSLLSKHHFKKLPVVNETGRVVGVISRGDVLRIVQSSLLEKL